MPKEKTHSLPYDYTLPVGSIKKCHLNIGKMTSEYQTKCSGFESSYHLEILSDHLFGIQMNPEFGVSVFWAILYNDKFCPFKLIRKYLGGGER